MRFDGSCRAVFVLRVEELGVAPHDGLEALRECSTPRPSDVAVLLVRRHDGLAEADPAGFADDYLCAAAAEFISLSERTCILPPCPGCP